jgi:hypothetical protein
MAASLRYGLRLQVGVCQPPAAADPAAHQALHPAQLPATRRDHARTLLQLHRVRVPPAAALLATSATHN